MDTTQPATSDNEAYPRELEGMDINLFREGQPGGQQYSYQPSSQSSVPQTSNLTNQSSSETDDDLLDAEVWDEILATAKELFPRQAEAEQDPLISSYLEVLEDYTMEIHRIRELQLRDQEGMDINLFREGQPGGQQYSYQPSSQSSVPQTSNLTNQSSSETDDDLLDAEVWDEILATAKELFPRQADAEEDPLISSYLEVLEGYTMEIHLIRELQLRDQQ